MGTGCESVTRIASADADVVVGKWKDGRIGTVRAIRPYSDYGAIVNRGRETRGEPSEGGRGHRLPAAGAWRS